MPNAWRIVKAAHAASPLDGEGAWRFGGRWTSPGRRVVYAAWSLALATLEVLVHLGTAAPLAAYVSIALDIPDGVVRRLPASELPDGWRDYPASAAVRALGDAWLASGESAVLEVPSVVVGNEFNVLLNPSHRDIGRVVASFPVPFQWDPRLRRAGA